MSLKNEAADFVVVGIYEGVGPEFWERKIGERHFGRDPFPLRSGSDASQLVAGFFFIGFVEQLAKIREDETLRQRSSATAPAASHGMPQGDDPAKKHIVSHAVAPGVRLRNS